MTNKTADMIITAGTLLTCKGNRKPKIKEEMQDVGVLSPGAVAVKDGIIVDVASPEEIEKKWNLEEGGEKIEYPQWVLMPGLIDSHTHPVFAGNRVQEFIMRAGGATYQEIHNAGGGIQYTVNATRNATFDELYNNAKAVIMRMREHGTTTIEAKSGYGLNVEEEIRELEIIKKLNRDLPVNIIPTFLGAHSIPEEYKHNREEYIRIIIQEMLPVIKEKGLAEFVDAFCEEGAFTLEETRRIFHKAKELGLALKVHGEEFTNTGISRLSGQMGAVSADHLLRLSDEDIKILAETDTILTLMPGTLFFLGYNEYAPARRMIDQGCKVALATDYNAGSCMSESMLMAMSLGCIRMKMTPEEVINASTYNASFAVGRNNSVGSIQVGKKADMIVIGIDDYRLIPYHFGVNLVKRIIN